MNQQILIISFSFSFHIPNLIINGFILILDISIFNFLASFSFIPIHHTSITINKIFFLIDSIFVLNQYSFINFYQTFILIYYRFIPVHSVLVLMHYVIFLIYYISIIILLYYSPTINNYISNFIIHKHTHYASIIISFRYFLIL